ncbi:MAG TPA: glycosyltransferase family 1 protein [Gemmatimonadales bacterium]|nr:glycosyltransferase family 1 protein [Gemmatimonadales bacterium]
MSTTSVYHQPGRPSRPEPLRTEKRLRLTVDARMVNASGIGTYLTNLLPRIIGSRPEWHFTLLGIPDELRDCSWALTPNVTIVPCHALIYGIGEQIQLAARIPGDTDLVWSPHYNIPLAYRGRLLVSIHDVCHLALPQLVKGIHRRAYTRLMLSQVRRRASRILFPSAFTAAEFRRLVGETGPKSATVPYGVSPRWFEVRPTERPHPRPYLLFVGNVKPHKNLGTLIQAFGSIAGRIPHDLVVVGKHSGFITGDSPAVAVATAPGDRVHFTGKVAADALEQFVVNADALVLPSLYEGFGLPPLEAMACGCPTIVSRAGSLPEMCGDASLYFDPMNPDELAATLLRVLSSEQIRQDLRQRGRRHAARYSWDSCAEKTRGFLEQLALP